MRLPYEEKAITMYTGGASTKEVRETLNISNGQLYYVLNKNGIELRQPKKAKNKKAKTKRCPNCKANNNPADAKFCCMCGSDIRNEADICIANLDKAMTLCIQLLPTNSTEEVLNAMRQARRMIERGA